LFGKGCVLKSWAISKRLSRNSEEKPRATMCQDHSYFYKDFEDMIRKSNYGAGKVLVWDNGTYILVDEQKEREELMNLKLG
jgi:bifunctional non-homologous end joining protein LigD